MPSGGLLRTLINKQPRIALKKVAHKKSRPQAARLRKPWKNNNKKKQRNDSFKGPTEQGACPARRGWLPAFNKVKAVEWLAVATEETCRQARNGLRSRMSLTVDRL